MRELYNRMFIALLTILAVGIVFAAGNEAEAEETDWIWPAKGEITDVFGTRGGDHNGVDVAAPIGTPVVATKSGVVTKSYYSGTYGNVIFILHNNGFESVYAHLNTRLVEEGDTVKQGQLIGKIGNTGRSTGSHLHFEVHNGRWNIEKTNAVNPVAVMDIPQLTAGKHVETAISRLIARQVKVQDSFIANSTDKKPGKKVVVTIEKGNTLWGIGHHYDVPVKLIKKWNDLDSSILSIGQKIVVYPEKVETYTVEKGDTLPEISKKTGVSLSELIKYNKKLKNNPIYPSQILVLSVDQTQQ